MILRLSKLVLFLLLLIQPAMLQNRPWTYSYNGKPECAPQKTPRFGTKWCNFTRIASELNSVCYYNCITGYFLLGPTSNTCKEVRGGRVARFEPEQGRCKRERPKMKTSLANFHWESIYDS